MSKEIRYILDQICHEKGIPRGTLTEMIEGALLTAIRKKFDKDEDIHLKVDPNTYEITVYTLKKAVKKVVEEKSEIEVDAAREIDKEVGLGDEVRVPLDVKDLGRIAAQTVKQVILQKVREAERGVIYEKYIDKVGTIAAGAVLRKDRGNYIISLGKAEAVLPVKETIHNEHMKVGDTVRAYIDLVNPQAKGPQILLSRTSTKFVAELFRLEVPEISDGIVEVKDVVREPGERTKIAVYSKDQTIDPVGACVGMKGTRVQAIVRELRGERIDIINWTDDPRLYIARALTPSEVDKIGLNEEDKSAMVVVEDAQLSLAIGKKGQNVKLAMKLTGWNIDIISETNYSKVRQSDTDKSLEDLVREDSKE